MQKYKRKKDKTEMIYVTCVMPVELYDSIKKDSKLHGTTVSKEMTRTLDMFFRKPRLISVKKVC